MNNIIESFIHGPFCLQLLLYYLKMYISYSISIDIELYIMSPIDTTLLIL